MTDFISNRYQNITVHPFECFGVEKDGILGNDPRSPQSEPIECYIVAATQIGMLIMNQLDEHLHLPEGTLASLQRLD